MQDYVVKLSYIQNYNSVRLNILSLKYQRLTLSGCKDMGIRIFEFVSKPQFLQRNMKVR